MLTHAEDQWLFQILDQMEIGQEMNSTFKKNIQKLTPNVLTCFSALWYQMI